MNTKSSGKHSRTTLRRLGTLAGLACAGALAFGCAFDGADLAAKGQAIGVPGSTLDWRSWYAFPTATNIDSDPALCGNAGTAWFFAVRNSDQRYYVQSHHYIGNPEWKQFGARQFNSAPSCVFQQPFWDTTTSPSDKLFLMAGKSIDNRIYVIQGEFTGEFVPGDSFAMENPDWTGPWAQLSATTYSGTNGLPALGSSRERVVVTFLDGGRLYAHAQTLPYTNSAAAWGGRIQGPLLPSGVTASGVPAIIYMDGATESFVVMIRGTAGTTAGLYWVYFDGSQFVGPWHQTPTTNPVDSDPSLEWDGNHDTVTVYFRTGNAVTQTSAHLAEDLGVYAYKELDELGEDQVILGAPRAVFGASIEASGARGVAVRGYDWQASEPNLSAWVLHIQDNTESNLQCESGDISVAWNESDVDCGGDLCTPCADGKTCNFDADCASHTCEAGICVPEPEPASPCDAYCTSPTSISFNPALNYQSGDLGTGTTCREVTQFVNGMWCGNFAAGKQLLINGTAINCSGSGGNRTPPAPQNGGYCIQSTAGNHSYASYSLWDTTQGQTPL